MLMFKRILTHLTILLFALVLVAGCSSGNTQEKAEQGQPAPQNRDVILATTTSTQDSGLLDVLIPEFEKKTGYTRV